MNKNRCCMCNAPLEERGSWYGLHSVCFKQWFGLSSLDSFSDVIPRSQSTAPLEPQSQNTSFFHGAFRKYSSRLGEDHYILKVMQERHPELQVTEFLCNQIYQMLGVPIPGYHLIKYPDKEFCFVTKNFMARELNASLIHIWHYLRSREEYNCETLVALIGEKTGRRIEQEKFVHLTLADSLIGNHDRHGRNIGFIQSPKGIRLAPFYDNPSYIGLDDDSMLGADLQPRGAIFTKETEEPTMKDYCMEWRRLGFGNVVESFQKIYSFQNLKEKVEASLLSEKRAKALLRIIHQRGQELCGL